jgi:hypothetical protein
MWTVSYVMIVQVRGVQRAIRSLEGDVLLLHSQVDEADRVIAGQREGDKQVTSSLLILTAQHSSIAYYTTHTDLHLDDTCCGQNRCGPRWRQSSRIPCIATRSILASWTPNWRPSERWGRRHSSGTRRCRACFRYAWVW